MPRSFSRILPQTIGRVAFALALGCAATGLIGLAGRYSPAADAINQLLPFWTGLGLACGVLAALIYLRGRIVSVLLTILLVLLGGPSILRETWFTPNDRGTGKGQWRMIQFNLAKDNVAPEQTAAWILTQNADVLVVEEGLERGSKVTAQLKAAYPWRVSCHGQGRCSTMIFSRIPFDRAVGLAKGDAENRRALSAAGASFLVNGHRVDLVGVHLVRPWPFDAPRASVDKLGGLINQRPTQNLIISGDLNMTPWTYAARHQDKVFGIARLTHGLLTWPARVPGGSALPFPFLAIDQVYAGRCWQAMNIGRGPRLGSDHYPVVVDWTFNGAARGC